LLVNFRGGQNARQQGTLAERSATEDFRVDINQAIQDRVAVQDRLAEVLEKEKKNSEDQVKIQEQLQEYGLSFQDPCCRIQFHEQLVDIGARLLNCLLLQLGDRKHVACGKSANPAAHQGASVHFGRLD
jgi:hypothetical protein